MTFFMALMLFLHFLGLAVLVGTWIATFKTPTVTKGQLYGAILMLVTGLAMFAGIEMDPDRVANHMKIGVKILILLVILVASIIGSRKASRGEPVSTGLAHAVGGMAVINTAVAVFW